MGDKRVADNLVIVESPAKAKTIEKYLGKRYKVIASMGHVRDLPRSQTGIDTENNYEPKYITIRGKGPLLKELKKEAKKAKKVFLASDPDREGEAIAWHLSHALGPIMTTTGSSLTRLLKMRLKIALNHLVKLICSWWTLNKHVVF